MYIGGMKFVMGQGKEVRAETSVLLLGMEIDFAKLEGEPGNGDSASVSACFTDFG